MTLLLWKRLRLTMLAGYGIAIVGLAALPAHAETMLVIRDFVVSRDIQQREPVGRTDSFQATDSKAIAFARIWNGGQPVRISFRWKRGEKLFAEIPATVGASPAWRTWTKVSLRPGSWRVALVDPEGAVLAERAFTVDPVPTVPVTAPVKPAPAHGAISFDQAPDPLLLQIPASANAPGQ